MATAVLLAALTGATGSLAAEPMIPEVVVEIDRKASRLVDPTLTRRLVAIELGDLDVPVAPDGEPAPEHRSLFVRLVGASELEIRVELWELGRLLGERNLTFAEGTSEQLRARRIALVAAALGREVAVARRREAARLEAQARLEEEARRAAAARPPPVRTAVAAGVRGAIVGAGALALAGPRIEGSLRLEDGSVVGVGLAALAGTAPKLDGAPPARWSELSLAPGWSARLGPHSRGAVGLDFAAALVTLPRVHSVDGLVGERTSWTARGAGRLELEREVGRSGGVVLGAAAGAVLRRVPVIDRDEAAAGLGGVWVGLDLGWVLDPRRRGPIPPVVQPAGAAASLAAPAKGSPTAPRSETEAAPPRPLARGGSSAP